jgi:hypothetical protein
MLAILGSWPGGVRVPFSVRPPDGVAGLEAPAEVLPSNELMLGIVRSTVRGGVPEAAEVLRGMFDCGSVDGA